MDNFYLVIRLLIITVRFRYFINSIRGIRTVTTSLCISGGTTSQGGSKTTKSRIYIINHSWYNFGKDFISRKNQDFKFIITVGLRNLMNSGCFISTPTSNSTGIHTEFFQIPIFLRSRKHFL